jgi:N utilization substance protein B
VSARGKARKRALDMIFECDARGLALDATLAERSRDAALNPYAAELVSGVAAHQARIDEVLEAYSQGWPLDRMPAVDRAVLRLGVYELLYSDEVPAPVAVSEAVRLATELSTDESPAFVNGLLGHVADLSDELRAEETARQNGGTSGVDDGSGGSESGGSDGSDEPPAESSAP